MYLYQLQMILYTIIIYIIHSCLSFQFIRQSTCHQLSNLYSSHSNLPTFQIQERYLNNNKNIIKYILSSSHIYIESNITTNKHSFTNNLHTPLIHIQSLYDIIKSTFIPYGYPLSVPKEYKTFQLWNLLQDFCSYLRGILSTKAILEGFGVGNPEITSVQAAVQWILRDGASMIGGLLFTAFSSADFGQNVKSWRLFADFINNIGISLDMIAPLFRKHFLMIICISSVCKCLCGIAAGASNGVINSHWGYANNNIADVMAKNNAQHTVLSLIGLSISIPFANFANGDIRRMFVIYGVLTIVHMYSNIQAMKVLALRTINISRYQLLCKKFTQSNKMKEILQNYSSKNIQVLKQEVLKELEDADYLSLEYIGFHEPLFSTIFPSFLQLRKDSGPHLCLSLLNLIQKKGIPVNFIQSCLLKYQNEKYTIIKYNDDVYLALRKDCDGLSQAKAIFESYLTYHNKSNNSSKSEKELDSKQLSEIIFPHFWKQLSDRGFDTERVLLNKRNAIVYSLD